MISFCIALAVLVLGYIVYGAFVTRVFGVDAKRPTPVTRLSDGVDYVEIPTWRIFLIQFLNIAGLGPIFGAIMGVMFGPAAFLWIVLGTIFAGAVHDFFSAMMSLRMDGDSLPEITGRELGRRMRGATVGLSLFLLVMVGAVFIYNPADLLAMLTPGSLDRTFWVVVIFIYYIAATMLPIDKIIGRLYPLFGFVLLFMAVGILAMLFVHGSKMPEIWEQFYNHMPDPSAKPVFPMMFVSIACGAISGFHATQSPMMARCLRNERHGRAVFYGAMVAEGIVALIWAAAAIAFCGGYSGLQEYVGGNSPSILVHNLSISWMGSLGGLLAILGVVLAPISTGDTALRSARLVVADALGMEQKTLTKRLLISIPLFVVVFTVMMLPYDVLWHYFAWVNQTLAAVTLWAIAVWLARNSKPYLIAMVPAMFMTVVVTTYLLFAPEGLGLLTDALLGLRIGYEWSLAAGCVVALLAAALFFRYLRRLGRRTPDQIIPASGR